MFLLSFIVPSINATETRLVWTFFWEGINVEIYTPYQAYPNQTMTIRVRVEATEDLQDVTIRFRIYGSKSEGYLSWFNSFYAFYNVDLSSGIVEDQYFNVSIPEDVDPGLIYSQTSCSWKVWRESSWQSQSNDGVFRVTYLRNKPYEDLQVAYNQLLANYDLLQTNYNELLANYSSLLSSYNTLQTDYNQLLADYNSLQTGYDDLENNYNNLQANYSILENNYNTLLTNYEELLANRNSLQSSFDSLQNDHNNLQTSYDSLNFTYYSLLSNYTSLQSSFNELKSKYEFAGEIASSLNLMYVFIEMTVVFIATTIYFARARIYSALRKPKPRQQT
jgi:archaellum component FlaC